MNIKLKIITFMVIGFIALTFINTYYHEQAHKQIGIQHGCINDKVELNWKGGLYTCNNYMQRTDEVKMSEKQLHMINEIVTYNLNSISYTIFLASLGIILTLVLINQQKGNN